MKISAGKEFGLTLSPATSLGPGTGTWDNADQRTRCMHSVRGRIDHIVPDDRPAPRCVTVRSSAALASAAWTEKQHVRAETRRRARARYRRLPGSAAYRGGLGFWIHEG